MRQASFFSHAYALLHCLGNLNLRAQNLSFLRPTHLSVLLSAQSHPYAAAAAAPVPESLHLLALSFLLSLPFQRVFVRPALQFRAGSPPHAPPVCTAKPLPVHLPCLGDAHRDLCLSLVVVAAAAAAGTHAGLCWAPAADPAAAAVCLVVVVGVAAVGEHFPSFAGLAAAVAAGFALGLAAEIVPDACGSSLDGSAPGLGDCGCSLAGPAGEAAAAVAACPARGLAAPGHCSAGPAPGRLGAHGYCIAGPDGGGGGPAAAAPAGPVPAPAYCSAGLAA
eukprot:scaffold210777_cov14-Tisochrysis_lutea.AAC.1